MKNLAILSFSLMLFVTGAANSATTTVSYQVSAGVDDGFAQSGGVQDIASSYLKIGDDRIYAVPYQMSAMRFNGVNIPRSATITSAYLKINSITTDYRHQIYGVIAAEAADNPADFSGRLISNAALTAATVAWDFKDAWSPDTQYVSGDISNAIQEVVNRVGFSSGNSMAIYYSTRDLSGKARNFASYEYSPASAAVLEVTYETYTISGHILTTDTAPLEGASVSAGADIEGDVTDASGYYELKVPLGWSGTVTPSKTDWGFSPANQTYSSVSSDQINEDYTAFQPVISGYVKNGSGTGIEGVSVSADNGGGSDTTDATGYYQVVVPYDWTGDVTVTKSGWNLTPSSRPYSNVTSDKTNQDYTGFQPMISGVITAYGEALGDVTLTANNDGGTAVTDPAGGYAITVAYGWGGTITPSKPQYTFTPSQKSYSNVTTATASQNYTAILPPVSISGYVRDSNGTGIADVNITAGNGGGSAVTNSSGYYSISVPYNWSGTVTSNRLGWEIEPVSYSYSIVTTDQTNQNFLAINVGIIVKADGNGDYATIQSAIDAAINGDVVILQPGTYTGNGNRDIDFKGKAITVRGATGDPNDCIVDCQGTAGEPHRGFNFVSGEDSNSILESLTITNGYGHWEDVRGDGYTYPAGGGVFCKTSSPSISNCIFNSNDSTSYRSIYGSGICSCYNSNPIINNCNMTSDVANSTPSLIIYNYQSSPTIINSTIGNNSGIGIYNYYNSNSYISNCIINNNSGGGIFNKYSDPNINNCAITNNSTSHHGGGIYNNNSNPRINNCVISNNSADTGGGIYNYESSPTITNCTIINNSASDYGGVCDGYHSSSNIVNCIVWGNQTHQIVGAAAVTYSDIEGGYSGEGNIEADPFFDADGFHLTGVSPCIDAGDPNYIAEANETDIDGDPRVVYRIDIGADEFYSGTSALIAIKPGILNFEAQGLTSAPQSQYVSIKNYGAFPLNWHIENDCDWLIVEPLSGQTESLQTDETIISIDNNNIDYGLQTYQFRVIDPNAENSPQYVTVNLEVLGPEIAVNKTNLYFYAAGKSDPDVADQQIMITNTGYDTLIWQIDVPPDCNWLSALPSSGQVTDGNSVVMLSVDPNKAPEYGSNYATINIIDPNASNSPQEVEVRLNVNGPSMTIMPNQLNIYAEKDKTGEGVFVISNGGYDTIEWTIEVPNDCNWITSVSPLTGSCNANQAVEVTVNVDANGLELGYFYDTHFWVHSPQLDVPKIGYIYLHIYEPNKIHVPYDYPTLQEAVDAASDYGDTIIVHPGKYSGCNIYEKSLTIKSIEPNNSNIVAATIIHSGIEISAWENTSTQIDGLSFIYDPEYINQNDSAIWSYYDNDISISNCIIKNWPSGGIWIRDYGTSDIIIENCLIVGNSMHGIYFGMEGVGSNILINNCTIADTQVGPSFGIYAGKNAIYIHDWYGLNADMSITNSILDNTTSPNDIEIHCSNHSSERGSNLTISHCDIPAGIDSIYIGDTNFITLNYGPDNIETDPCFVSLGYWHQNGTPADANDDFWVDGDYHLKSEHGRWQQSKYVGLDPTGDGFIDLSDFAVLAGEWGKTAVMTVPDVPAYMYSYRYLRSDLDNSGVVDLGDLSILLDNWVDYYDYGQWVYDDVTSPCIDAGDANSDWMGELWPHGKRINMGAYGGTPQASMSLSTVGNKADLNHDGFVDAEDLALFVDMWLSDQMPLSGDINRNGSVNFSDFAVMADNWLTGF